LRSHGGCAAQLRVAAPAASGDDAEQLGLATPQFQDIPIYPAAFRRNESPLKLLVSASAVEGILGTLAFDSADVLFETAVGVVVDGVLYAITDSVASQALGEPFCYCLTLRGPAR
jgi:hypothetical protein